MSCESSHSGSSASLRILLVTSLFAPEVGGVCSVAEALARELNRQVTVVAPKTPALPEGFATWEAYDAQFPFRVHRIDTFETELSRHLPSRLRGALQYAFNVLWTRRRVIRSIRGFLRDHPADIVCLNTLGSYWVPSALQESLPGLKSVFYLHGEELGGGGSTRRADELRRNALRKADAIVAVSSFTRDLAVRGGIPADTVTVINNGVDTERFTPGPKDRDLEERLGINGRKVLLCLARLDARKGQDMLIRAMPQILNSIPDSVLLLVGSGHDFSRLAALTESLELGPHVIFAGAASDAEVVSYYRIADIYAMPNRDMELGNSEGFGLVFLEAGACAKPVIGGNAGGVPDAIVDGKTGYLVDGTSSSGIAEACVRLLQSPDLAAELGRNGLAHSRENTWAIQAQRLLRVCGRISQGSQS